MDPKIQIRTEKIPLLLNQTNKKLNMLFMYNNKITTVDAELWFSFPFFFLR